MVADNGAAPCVWRGLLSLSICKPKIRRSASATKGDLIFGFGGKGYDERLIYIACVTEKPATGDYYKNSKYSHRPDCIYTSVAGRAIRKPRARYHTDSDQRRRDVGLRLQRAD